MKLYYATKVRLTCGSTVLTHTENAVKIGDDVNYVWYDNAGNKYKIGIGTVTEIIQVLKEKKG